MLSQCECVRGICPKFNIKLLIKIKQNIYKLLTLITFKKFYAIINLNKIVES
jgi:hypothetical protein